MNWLYLISESTPGKNDLAFLRVVLAMIVAWLIWQMVHVWKKIMVQRGKDGPRRRAKIIIMFRLPFPTTITACCCVAAFACDTQAQEAPSNRASAKSSGLRERISKDLKKWDSITDHRTGSEGDIATANWLAEEIRAVGLKPHLDQFEFQRRVLKDC